MPMLLEDLAEETSASNRRLADRLDAEVQDLAERRSLSAREDLSASGLDVARLAIDFAIARVPQAEGFMRAAVTELRKEPTGDSAEGLLKALLHAIESCLRLVRAARSLWLCFEQSGVVPERFDELDRAERRFEELAADAKLALEHRAGDWRPADPARLALGLQQAREGKTVKAEEARSWFRGAKG